MIDYDGTVKALEENFEQLSKSCEERSIYEYDSKYFPIPDIKSGDGLVSVDGSISVNHELMRDISLLRCDSLLRKDKYKLKLSEYFLMKYQEGLEEILKKKLSWDREEIEDFIEGRKQFDVEQIDEIENQFGITIYDILKG